MESGAEPTLNPNPTTQRCGARGDVAWTWAQGPPYTTNPKTLRYGVRGDMARTWTQLKTLRYGVRGHMAWACGRGPRAHPKPPTLKP